MRLQAIVRGLAGVAMMAALGAATVNAQAGADKLLTQAELTKLFPATVYYYGQSAATQIRNSGGVKFADGHYVLAALVDTSGYSTGVAEKYQGYLIAEVPIKICGKALPAGAYGFGFLAGNKFLITDLGGSDVFTVDSMADSALKRPRPLQLTAEGKGYRLYAGVNFVEIER